MAESRGSSKTPGAVSLDAERSAGRDHDPRSRPNTTRGSCQALFAPGPPFPDPPSPLFEAHPCPSVSRPHTAINQSRHRRPPSTSTFSPEPPLLFTRRFPSLSPAAVVAELVDAPDSGSGDLTIVGVRLSPTALFQGLAPLRRPQAASFPAAELPRNFRSLTRFSIW